MADRGEVILRGVTHRFARRDSDVVALTDVSLSIQPKTAVALWGPSGSGKTTMLQLIGALDRPDAGEVVVDGRRLNGLSRRQQARYRAGIGFVFQRFNLLPGLSVLDNVVAPLLPHGVSFDRAERAGALLTEVGIAARAGDLPARLSGGEQQRVAIARALINRPSLILADEPTGNLDSATGESVIDLLLGSQGSRRTTVIIATHDPKVARRCDRIIALLDGRVDAETPDMQEWSPRGEPALEGE